MINLNTTRDPGKIQPPMVKQYWGTGKERKINKRKTALVYCENQFGLVDGKTAAALIRHSEIYDIVGVIDSSLAGKDSGEELGEKTSGIPIFKNLEDAFKVGDELSFDLEYSGVLGAMTSPFIHKLFVGSNRHQAN